MVYLATKIMDYNQLKEKLYSSIKWCGENRKYICFENSSFSFQKDHVIFCVNISVLLTKKNIVIQSNVPVEFEQLYLYLNDVRRFEYLSDGAFYAMKECFANNEDVSEIIKSVELGYFQSEGCKHKIPLELSDKEYKKYFLKWSALQKKLGIINQMTLFANCVNGLTSDLRLSMLSECLESLGKKLEKSGAITVYREPDSNRTINCTNCGKPNSVRIKGKKTLACYMKAIIDQYGKPIFATEFRRRKSLINHIVKTRNKVFHVDSKKKNTLRKNQNGFYAIKLEWLFRYIICLQMGYNKNELDIVVGKEIVKFENEFPQLIYQSIYKKYDSQTIVS